jgi:diguanylate cyclase (GGDEF)-like protein/PAS domain S-box-containing protein
MATGLLNAEFASIAWIGFAIAAVATACLAFSFGRLMEARRAASRGNALQIQRQAATLDIALNNMSQGLVMFDGDTRAVLWNQRYLEISGVNEAFMRQGPTFREILVERQKAGTFAPEIDIYIEHQTAGVASGDVRTFLREDPNGRFCHVVVAPMPGGGWVATHEDITAQVNAKKLIEEQRMQLNAAISNMSQGLCMFDKDQRLIVCNQQYADIYGMPDELKKPGTLLSAILRNSGHLTHDANSVEAFIEDRVKKVQSKKAYEIVNRLKDGRSIAVVHRAMPDGGWVSTHEDVTEAKRREESFRLLFDDNPMAMWVIDRETLRFLAVNEAVIEQYGYSREQFMAMTVPELRPPDEREKFAEQLKSMPLQRQLQARNGKHYKADGSAIDIEVYSRPFTYDGRPAWLVVVHDITRAKLATDELSRTRKFLDAVIENVPVPLIVRDVTGLDNDLRNARFNLFNRAYEKLTGDDRSSLIGKTVDELYSKARADMIIAADKEVLNGDGVVDIPEHTIETNANGPRRVIGKKTLIRDDTGKPEYLLTVLDDVTDRRRAEARIAYLARTDSLTELPNRATFVEFLDQTLTQAGHSEKSFAILCVDLDRFKEANDVYGHLVGDELLREAARRLNAAADGQFLARVGGDEFTLVATGCGDAASTIALSEKLLAAFQPAFEVGNQRLSLGLSIGGAIYPGDGNDATTLIANADAALYQAKAESRGSLRLFDARLAAQLHNRREIQLDLHSAIERGEFLLHYQPQEKVSGGEITGFESLVRWQCPSRGMISPGDFISIAEETGLIVPLGNWILREACREAASWPKPLKIAVNISPIQFHSGDLAAQVHLILLETGLAPGRLELEITEGVMIDDFSRAISILRKLKALGVQIAMDDFGSGYSSLSYLHSFAFDKIKIDRSFIGDIEENHHSMAIVRAIVTLGHSLGVPVLAEGVETPAQRQFLADEGCDGAQGYLLGRPQPIAAYAALVGRDGKSLPDSKQDGQRDEKAQRRTIRGNGRTPHKRAAH